MSEFKGTPGPWEAKKIHGDLKVIQKGSYEKLAPGMVSYCCITEIENKYDANLIAAAPELLKELQNLRKYVIEVLDVGADGCHPEHPLMSLKVTIAKALGVRK